MECEKNQWWRGTENRRIDLFFLLLLMVYALITGVLFYKQTVIQQPNITDMQDYVSVLNGTWDGRWNFPYPIMFWAARLFRALTGSPYRGMALAVTTLNLLTAVFMKYYMECLVPDVENHAWVRKVLIDATVFALLFTSMIYLPESVGKNSWIFQYRYASRIPAGTCNPWHNATFFAARPFIFAPMFAFARLLQCYEKRMDWRDGAILSVVLLLATMTKPSFTLVFVSTAGLIMLWRLLRSKFANFKQSVLLGLCFVPTFIDMLYQAFGLFGGANEADEGIGFGFGKVFRIFSGNIPLSLLMGSLFPLVVLLYHRTSLRTRGEYRLSWQIWVVGLAEAFFMYQKGFRMDHANFLWGYECALVLVFFTSAILLVRDTLAPDAKQRCKALAVQWAALLVHVAFGICKFISYYDLVLSA